MQNLEYNCKVLQTENQHLNEKLNTDENFINSLKTECEKYKVLHFESEKNVR